MRALVSALSLILLAPTSALAQPRAFELPWADVAPHIEGEVVKAAAVAGPDERIGRFAPRRASARSAGRARALAMLHRWVDRSLAPLRADPREAQAAHDAIEASARVEGVRALTDGGAVVVVAVPLEALRDACAVEGAPWTR